MDVLWSQEAGRVSRAYDEWQIEEKYLREFLQLSLRFADAGYPSLWEERWAEPRGEEAYEFDDMAPQEYERLLLSYVLRDGVSLYEVYLEKALEEVWEHRVGRVAVGLKSPFLRDMQKVYQAVLDCDIRPPEIDAIVAIRDLLTHRRGELRTDQHVHQYDTQAYMFPDLNLQLGREGVVEALDRLAVQVRRTDQPVYMHTWGRVQLPPERNRSLRSMAARWFNEGRDPGH